MIIFPAIDLIDGKAVRLLRGDYDNMTVYSDSPADVACGFSTAGAEYLHVVDLQGAKTGGTPNINTVEKIVRESGLNVEIGGGIRSMQVVQRYLDIGVMRVILGTAAVTDDDFLRQAIGKYGERIAVGVDIRDGNVAINGWTQTTSLKCIDFFAHLERLGVKTVICTDISKDGVLGGTNLTLYSELSDCFGMDIVASGGVSSLSDVAAIRDMGLYGAILGKALYTGDVDLSQAIKAAHGSDNK